MPAERRTWAGAATSPSDVRALLDRVNAEGLTRGNTTALAEAVRTAPDVEHRPDASRLLPAPDILRTLLPWPGLPRGATITVPNSTTVLLSLLAAGMREGSWAAVVGMPDLGALAALELGVPLDRLALVPNPGPDWPTVVAALIDGVDLVAVGAPATDDVARRLQARAREKGCVLIPTTAWPRTDLVLEVTARRWEGLGQGRGRLKRQILDLRSSGRGKAARPRTATVMFGQPEQPLRIPPPPPHLHPEPASVPANRVPAAGEENPLWENLVPNKQPDMWADLNA